MKTLHTHLTRRMLCFAMTIAMALAVSFTHGQTPVARNGQLRVIGTKLCNQFGNPIQLRGMSTHGIQWYGWGSCLTEASLDAMAYDWGSDILRISLYVQEGGYETDPVGYTAQVTRLIEEATERGMYALVDWHQLTPGDPNANLTNAKRFFTDIANAHKNKVNIIYDICNEPNGVAWSRIKTYADQIIPVIRAIDADAPIFMGTHGWASLGISDGRTAQDIVSNPVNFPNIMYTFHFYAASHGDAYLNELNWASDRLPIFVTEFGSQTASGDGTNNFTMTQRYIDLMRTKKIGWTNWNYSDDFRSGAVWQTGTCSAGPWTVSRLKPAGVWIRERMLSPADDFPGGGNLPPTASITSPSSGATFTAPATITINANASDPDGTVAKVEFFQGSTKLGEDTSSPYSFTWSGVSAGSYNLTARATDNLGLAGGSSSSVSVTVQAPPTCPAVIASAHDGNVPENVLDNNFSTRWSASGDGQWIQFCLGTEQNVRGVDIAFYNGNVRQSIFDVLLSTNGSTWTNAATGLRSSGTSLALETFTFTARLAKYVRILGHGNSVNLWNSYTEVRVLTGVPNSPPAVSISSPSNGATFTAPASITINANASDTDGTITQVAFYNGSTLLGTDTSSPYSFSWTSVGAGTYSLTARATDNAGAVTTSSAVSVTVQTAVPCDPVIASSHDGNVPANVLDNDLNTRWSASGDGQWIQFCLSATSSISGVQIAFYKGNERRSTFDVLISSDAATWTTAASGLQSSGTSLALQTFSFTARTGKYVRIVGHGNNLNLWNSYTEVRINSTAAGARQVTEEIATTDESGLTQPAIRTYPNPAEDKVTVTYTVNEDGRVRMVLYNANGRDSHPVLDAFKKAGMHETIIDLQQLPKGMHILKLIQNKTIIHQKIIKQ